MSVPLTRRGWELLAMLVMGLAFSWIAYAYQWIPLAWVAGGYTCLAVDAAIRETIEAAEPATRAERKRARRMVQAANKGGPMDPTMPAAGG